MEFTLHSTMHLLDLFGTAVFAITGALAAGRKKMDIFGVVVLGCVTALGGGTLRDLILGCHPVFWISNTEYLGIAAVTSIGIFISARYWKWPQTLLLYADALGLAVFTVIGFQKGLEVTQTYSIGIVMGLATAVVGGIIRDLLSGEIPLILRREIYASASLSGALLLALMSHLGLTDPEMGFIAALVVLFFRLIALHWNLSLPLLRIKEDGERRTETDHRSEEKK
ncbi:MAG: trimeric intracellular cation channel family protein [Thermodesulfobacteriota bacterium]